MNKLPQMPYAERMARNEAKKRIVLDFLASGESYTTVAVAADLLQMSLRRTRDALEGLVKDGSLKSEIHRVDAHSLTLYGITGHGLAIADKLDSPEFEKGRVNSAYIAHHIDGQRMRLKAEAAGWTGWTPDRAMRTAGEKRPDAFCISPQGYKVAIEIERHAKSPKRYSEFLAKYLAAITAKRFDFVYFVCPVGVETMVERSLRKVAVVKYAGDTVRLEEKHLARFKFFNFDTFCEVKNG